MEQVNPSYEQTARPEQKLIEEFSDYFFDKYPGPNWTEENPESIGEWYDNSIFIDRRIEHIGQSYNRRTGDHSYLVMIESRIPEDAKEGAGLTHSSGEWLTFNPPSQNSSAATNELRGHVNRMYHMVKEIEKKYPKNNLVAKPESKLKRFLGKLASR